MYKTMLVFDSYELLNEIQALHIWGESSGFEIEDIAYDGITAYRKMKDKRYDLIITEIRITGIDGLQLLRYAKREGLCSHIVLCSMFLDFNYARQGIILGAFDYYIRPFEESMLFSMFNRIKNEDFENEAMEIYHIEKITDFFKNHDNSIYEYVSDMFAEIYDEDVDVLIADKKARQICKAVFDDMFNRNEWLDLYITEQDFYNSDNVSESNQETYKNRYSDMIGDLFNEYCELYPNANNDKIQEVILYILNYPEDNLKQKSIANKLYINSSYLSTVFMAHTGIRFVDYLTKVKLKRAAFLLKSTDMRIIDIAERLNYKDIGYFSKLFKKQYGMTPSEYRLPDDYNYQI